MTCSDCEPRDRNANATTFPPQVLAADGDEALFPFYPPARGPIVVGWEIELDIERSDPGINADVNLFCAGLPHLPQGLPIPRIFGPARWTRSRRIVIPFPGAFVQAEFDNPGGVGAPVAVQARGRVICRRDGMDGGGRYLTEREDASLAAGSDPPPAFPDPAVAHLIVPDGSVGFRVYQNEVPTVASGTPRLVRVTYFDRQSQVLWQQDIDLGSVAGIAALPGTLHVPIASDSQRGLGAGPPPENPNIVQIANLDANPVEVGCQFLIDLHDAVSPW